MIIKPKIRGFICASAHPVGCEQEVLRQINIVKAAGSFIAPKRILIIGASTGYGLASRIALAFGAGAETMGVFFERAPSDKRTASAGWYNSAAFEKIAAQEGLYAKSFNGDAFSTAIKEKVIAAIKEDWGQVDRVIYSLASPVRTDPATGITYRSCLKTIDVDFTNLTVDPLDGALKEITIDRADGDDIAHTIKVMGGDDWELWIDALLKAGVCANSMDTVAYSYIGPELTHPIYKDGTIGRAKEHLYQTAKQLNKSLAAIHGNAYIAVNKAVVTQASSAIPVVPLYISILIKEMVARGVEEGCIEQMQRLFAHKMQGDVALDADGMIRMDDLEMRADVQAAVAAAWKKLTAENITELADLKAYADNFYHLFGFAVAGVDYAADVDPMVQIKSIKE
jgi:enoyl-[acyl-carrier protein] reductase/trans-2-enoyl-CoA reductase (NAD+)